METESQLDEWGQLWCLMGYLDDMEAKTSHEKAWLAAGSTQLCHGAVGTHTKKLYSVLAEVWVLQPSSRMGRALPGSYGQTWLSGPCSPSWCRLAQTSCSYSACQQTLIKAPGWSELLRFVSGGSKKRKRQFLSDYLERLLHSRQYKSPCQVLHKSFICLSAFSVDNLIIGLTS